MSNKELLEQWLRRYVEREKKEAEEAKKKPKEETSPAKIDITEFKDAIFLEADFGKEILKEYNERVKLDYDDNPKLKVLNWNEDKKVVTGSNSFASVLINEILEKRDSSLRVALPADIEQTLLNGDSLKIKGNHYVDLGVVLRSKSDPNKYLAENLAEQVVKQGYSLDVPLVIPFMSLRLDKDSESNYGLFYKLKKNPKIFRVPVFIGANNTKKFSKADRDGFPILHEKGTRSLYTINSGLSRFYVSRYLSAYSGNENLASSDEYGRVVLVSSEAGTQKI